MYKVFFLICFTSLGIFSTDYPDKPIKITQELEHNIFNYPKKDIAIKFYSRSKRNAKFEPDVLGSIGKARFIKLEFGDNSIPLINISLANPIYQNKLYEIITLNKDKYFAQWNNRSYNFMLDYNKIIYQNLHRLLGDKRTIHVYLLIKITYPGFESIPIYYQIICKGHKYESKTNVILAKKNGVKEENRSFRLCPSASLMTYYVSNIKLINSNFAQMPIGLIKNAKGQFVNPDNYEIIVNENEGELDRMLEEQEQAIEKAEEEGVVFIKTNL
jgi:hypothetical protein